MTIRKTIAAAILTGAIVVTSVPLTAHAGGADLAHWQSNYGAGGSAAPATGGADLGQWQSHYGSGDSAAPASDVEYKYVPIRRY